MAESETSLPVGIDRISSLPQPILIHILSMLPTRCAIPTSLLSSRWRYLWTSITNLDIVDVDFFRSLPKLSLDMKRKTFTRFVNRVLIQLNSPCMHTFHLELHKDHWDPFYLDSWICAAFGRTAQELYFVLKLGEPFEFPLSHLYCKTTPAVLKLTGYNMHFNIVSSSSRFCPNLQTLHLTRVKFKIASGCSVNFPSLKELFLQSVNFQNDESVNKLLASCPVLDNLYIDRSGSDSIGCLIISIPSLKSLKIVMTAIYIPFGQELHIDTPALKYLHLDRFSSNVFIFGENLSSVLEARLEYYEEYDRRYINNFFEFMGVLLNVKFLSISGYILKVNGVKSANFSPGFCNLSRLELNYSSCLSWSVAVKNLLDSILNLEHLVMKGRCGVGDTHESCWMKPLHVPLCLLQRVTTISFLNVFGNCSGELELVRFFLKNAKVLQQLTVHINGGLVAKLQLVLEISMMPRGSQACQVAFEGLEM